MQYSKGIYYIYFLWYVYTITTNYINVYRFLKYMQVKTSALSIGGVQLDTDFFVLAFEQDCEIRGLSKGTIASYKSVIKRYLAEYPIKSGLDDFKGYLVDLRNDELSHKTIENHFTALSTFFDFLEFEGYIGTNDILKFRKRYLRTYKSSVSESSKLISIKDMSRLIMSPEWIGDKALLIFMAKTGIRRNELITLDISDVNLENNSFLLKPTAKRSNRLLFFDDETKAFLLAYLGTRRDSNPALFLGHCNNRVSRDYVYYLVTEHAFKLGLHNHQSKRISDRFTPHNFRHFFTSHILKAGMLREYIQELRGDAKKEAIDIYVHISPEDLKEAYLKHVYQFNVVPCPDSCKKRALPKTLIRVNLGNKKRSPKLTRRALKLLRMEAKEE